MIFQLKPTPNNIIILPRRRGQYILRVSITKPDYSWWLDVDNVLHGLLLYVNRPVYVPQIRRTLIVRSQRGFIYNGFLEATLTIL